jgi:signal transduction histidine kinase
MQEQENAERVRILHLEDDPTDFELIHAMLEAEGISAVADRIDTPQELAAALEAGRHDLVLSDNSLPGFDGLSALKMTKEKAPELPFIFVSGTLGEETAIESLKNGATDYVLKQRLSRLGPAIRRALKESNERRRLRLAEGALLESEERFRQAQKMEVVGQLAGGMAHDFNNLLTPILSYCEFARGRLEPGNAALADIEQIERVAKRAEGLTRQLLGFCRRRAPEPKEIDLSALVADCEDMLKRLMGAEVRLVPVLGRDLPPIKADVVQIEQVLMNLVVNARDAMPAGGDVRIETSWARVEEDPDRQIPSGTYVILRVTDTGHGIDSDLLPRVFEPFFTTKEVGKGTGLGLSTVAAIVRQWAGHVEVESRSGLGTTFTVMFPRADTGARESVEPRDPRTRSSRGKETILLVEDDESVRALVNEVLRREGYAVIDAPSSAEALRICESGEARIDLVLADVVMPQLSGPDLVRNIQALTPGTAVLFMTGYGEKAHGMLSRESPCLQKPFTPRGLVKKVREVLDMPVSKAA